MPRNGAGTFSIENPIQVGALRSSAHVNENFSDAGAQITNTLPLDGTAGMSGPLRAAPGVQTAPGISFGNDTNVGFRRRAPDVMAWVAGGVDRFYIDAEGEAYMLYAVDIAGALSISGTVTGDGVVAQLEGLTDTGLARVIENDDEEDTPTLDAGIYPLEMIRDGNGTVLPIGVLCDIQVPFAGTLVSGALLSDQAGSASVSFWKDTLANFPPTVADAIGTLTLTDDNAVEDATLGGWTTTVAAGDVIRVNLNSVTNIKRLTILLNIRRFA